MTLFIGLDFEAVSCSDESSSLEVFEPVVFSILLFGLFSSYFKRFMLQVTYFLVSPFYFACHSFLYFLAFIPLPGFVSCEFCPFCIVKETLSWQLVISKPKTLFNPHFSLTCHGAADMDKGRVLWCKSKPATLVRPLVLTFFSNPYSDVTL
ncbi:hypothetical protein COLO4_07266 [Corchorus olitorius]|uniref:Uncharacterized protein n=1 Tax=Corchorus olitorius TaxID=93759 RepID=A0A1R3KKE9_9ROSI|nr:hypothetical protein COLO4_07266 [Corchorus olitorius]